MTDRTLLTLTGDDAAQFRKQTEDVVPSPEAIAAVEAGRAILRDIERDGVAVVTTSPRKRRHD